jgi:hypothetical protein
MADKTKNYGLTKPNLEDFYDVNVQNENMDIIDEELKKRTPSLATYYPANSAKSADELTDPFALIPVSLDVNSELFNIIGGTFAWVWTNFYLEASVTSRRMQIAMSYNATDCKIAFRIYGSAGWLAWKELANADLIPKSAADIGAFPSTGGVVNGQITLKKDNNGGSAKLNKNHSESADYGFAMTDYDKDGKCASLNVRAKEDAAYFVDNNDKYHKLYHEGNKPTVEGIGASPATHNHDDRYYTESEIDAKLQGLPVNGHKHTKSEITDFPTSMTPTAHNHAATDINSGTLNSNRLPTVPVTKGGTGATDAATARSNLGITPANIGAAASQHGNHVPATGTPDSATFLRNDNTWQKVTPTNIGAAPTSHKHTKSEITDFPNTETWTFTLEDGSTVTKAVYVG